MKLSINKNKIKNLALYGTGALGLGAVLSVPLYGYMTQVAPTAFTAQQFATASAYGSVGLTMMGSWLAISAISIAQFLSVVICGAIAVSGIFAGIKMLQLKFWQSAVIEPENEIAFSDALWEYDRNAPEKGDALNIVKILLAKYPSLISKKLDSYDRTPLILAAERSELGLVKILLAANPKPDLDALDCRGRTPLMLAADNGNIDIVKALLSANPKPNLGISNSTGETVLTIAAERGHFEIVKLLFAANPHFDLKTMREKGYSVLMLAVYGSLSQKPDMIEFLLKTEPTLIGMRNDIGKTALMMAKELGLDKIVNILATAQAEFDAKASVKSKPSIPPVLPSFTPSRSHAASADGCKNGEWCYGCTPECSEKEPGKEALPQKKMALKLGK